MDEGKETAQNDISQGIEPQVQQSDMPHRSVMGEMWEIIKVLLISLAIVLPIRYFIVQPFIVRGASMEPNFYDKQYLIIDEASYYFRSPSRGEVIVFHYPKDTSQFFIKRIIGLPGEKVEIHEGRVMVFSNEHPEGMQLDETYLAPPNDPTYPDGTVSLSSSEYFLMGDNRDFSSDSRTWGPMDKKFMVGRTLFRAWPLNKIGFVTQ